jgi:uncharacterized membrane protein (GlpM family)
MEFLRFFMLFIAASFVASLFAYFKKPTPLYLKLFPPFLLLTLVIEMIGSYRSYYAQHTTTLYNFFSIAWTCFYLLIISLVINSRRVKKIIWTTIVLYAIAALINVIYIQKMENFHTITYSLGFLLIVLFCIYYFLELFRLPKSVNLINNPAFWICSGLLFFCCCTFPLFGFLNFWMNIKVVIKNFETILLILNIFLYSLFTIGFLCVRTRKYTLSSS